MGIYEVERNGKIYVYESTSKRVKGRKNPISTNTYLGVRNPETGELVPKKVRADKTLPADPVKEPVFSKHYGPIVFFDAVQRTIGLEEDLKLAFPDLYRTIMAAAMAQAIAPSVMDEVHWTVEDSVIQEYYNLRSGLSPATLSDLTKEIGDSMNSMEEFFECRYLRNKGKAYAVDVTSESSYGLMNGWAEWGYNRDGEDLEQTNWLLITGHNGLPMSFSMLPGSIADKSTLKFVVEVTKNAGLDGCALFDRGFETASNVYYLLNEGVDFVTPSNKSSKPIKKLISDSVDLIRNSKNQDVIDGRRYGHLTYDLGIVSDADGKCSYVGADSEEYSGSKRLKAHVIFDPRAETTVRDRFMNDIDSLSSELTRMKFEEAKEYLSKRSPELRDAIALSADDQGRTVVTKNENSISFTCNRAGIFVLLTPVGTDWDIAVRRYALRNEVEEAYDAYKNDQDGKRMRTPDPSRARGRFFIRMLSIMLLIYVRRVLRTYRETIPADKKHDDKVHKLTVREVVRSLNSINAVGSTGSWKLTYVTKTNRQIFEAFGLEQVNTGKVVLRPIEQVCSVKTWPEPSKPVAR